MSVIFVREGADLVCALGSRTYKIHGFQEFGGNLRASITVRQGADVLVRDILSLASARRRKEFAAKLNGDADAVERDLIEIGDALRVELAARQQARDAEAPANKMDDPVLWPDSVDGDVLLQDLLEAIHRFVVLPKHADVTAVLWIVAAHALGAWDVFPILAATSPTKRCGKTTLLDVLSFLLPRPLLASNISPAAVYRAIEAWRPSLLVDEVDTFLPNNDELRGVVNSSHNRAGAFVLRVEGEGENRQVVAFSTWCAKVLAGIGVLPATLEDRAIILRLRRKAKTERTERARRRTLEGFRDLSRQASRWAEDNLPWLKQADPSIPNELDDRAADNWQPLLAVADLAGGAWSELARKAAVALSAGRDGVDDEAGIRLLRDTKQVFESKMVGRIASVELVSALIADEEIGWSTWRRGRPLDQRGLARLLRPFGVGPKRVELPTGQVRGYAAEQFVDAWGRYLAPDVSERQEPNDNEKLGPILDMSDGAPLTDAEIGPSGRKDGTPDAVTDENATDGALATKSPGEMTWEEL